jgi:hypothetical protein
VADPRIAGLVDGNQRHQHSVLLDMSQMVTLICPEGAFDYPIAHGTRDFYPYREDIHSDDRREFGGRWLVDVPIEVYHHFLGRAGFTVYEPGE